MKNERINFKIDDIIKVSEKCGNKCSKCGSNNNLCIHHITPLSKKGDNDLSNLIILCKLCHKLIHKNKKEFYNEEEYYKNFGNVGYIKGDDYFGWDFGWIIDIDCTDHFVFKCPKCNKEVVIEKIFLKDFNSLKTPPCFYFILKCHYCKIKGQRKIYLNNDINEINKIKEINNETM